ncbi:PREDICTED: embryonic polarity protein dorsal-like [Ceratosolen solmsi marchali]|uniref:Embryonic polarity protein dorsal-like n=1 Tax=Ceratosolen solmsi marchali TaxID=326594 RepID=A0AAJ6YE83_9HYME|nr:PREDICTED: embryonic polarity protein dorsal-like [Ceratosolen solmsi marchali]
MHRNKPESIDLNCIRLCFQVFIETTQNLIPLQPIVSEPIYDKKAVSDLKICWLSHHSASVTGGTQMCVLCEKVSKLDIEVRFFHEESNWEAIAILTKPEVFRQVAIVFETPEYRTATCSPELVHEPLNVRIELRRISDKETSQTVPFQLLPLACVCYEANVCQTSIKRKREKYNEGHSGIISKKIQAEVTRGGDISQSIYSKPVIVKSSCELNELKDESFELSMLAKNSVESEPWELPPLHQSNYPQPQFSNYSQTHNCVNALIDTSQEKKATLIDNLDKYYNIESQEINALSPYQKYSSLDTLDSDSWINDLLSTINKEEHLDILTDEPTSAKNVTHISQEDFPNYNQINNNLPFTTKQHTDNFNNRNLLEESDAADFINFNIPEKMLNNPEDFCYNKDDPAPTESNALTDDSIQDFINLLNDLP